MYDKSIERRGHTRSLRNACRTALAAVAAAFLAFPAAAQTYANGLTVESIDPDADAAIIAVMRARMDSIHRSQHRPTVGLVLSGGGAKGSAHVGVLRYLEEQEIPVDAVFGTSMGGLVGGLYALGYSPAFMDSLLRNQNWSVTLTDRIDRSYYSYTRKKYRETYVFSVPFHYSARDFQSRIDDQLEYNKSGSDTRSFGTNSFMSSLPSGYVYGHNVNNLLSSLSVGYQDNISFADLPIPFFCTAADMVSCKTKNWSSGSLKAAMRSTMSIPGMFKPVRTRGMVLVDGGVRNNFPVDMAKAMGCDLVIGVDLSDQDLSYSQVNNLLDITMQFVTMLGKASFDRNKGDADVFIKPVLDGYNMLSFEPVAIDTMINRGYQAALRKAGELASIKNMMKGAKPYLSAPKAVDINKTPVQIYAIEFFGLTNAESRIMMRKLKFKAGGYVDKAKMDRMMSVIEATGCFSTVTYSIKGSEAPYKLIFECEKAPRNQFGVGVRFDSEEWPSFLFNVGFNQHKLTGFKLDLDAKIGRNQKIGARAALDLTWLPTINAEVQLFNTSGSLLRGLHDIGEDVRFWGHTEKLYLSNIKWTSIDLQAGVQNRYFNLPAGTTYGADINKMVPQYSSGNYAGFFAKGTIFTQDRFYYPSHGMKMTFGSEFDVFKSGVSTFEPLLTPYFNLSGVIPFGRFALVPDLHLRAVIGDPGYDPWSAPDPGYSLAHQNLVGGFIADRYMDGQIPFIGFGNVYMAEPFVAVMNLGLRYEPIDRFFLTATGGYFREADSIPEFLSTPLPVLWGAGFEIGYNALSGPIKLILSWSDRMHDFSRDLGVYVALGFDF